MHSFGVETLKAEAGLTAAGLETFLAEWLASTGRANCSTWNKTAMRAESANCSTWNNRELRFAGCGCFELECAG